MLVTWSLIPAKIPGLYVDAQDGTPHVFVSKNQAYGSLHTELSKTARLPIKTPAKKPQGLTKPPIGRTGESADASGISLNEFVRVQIRQSSKP
jgi:hypothetical protein